MAVAACCWLLPESWRIASKSDKRKPENPSSPLSTSVSHCELADILVPLIELYETMSAIAPASIAALNGGR